MAEDRIDSIIDRDAVQAEVDATKKDISDLVALIKAAKGTAIGATEATNSGDFTKKAKELSLIMTNIEQQQKAVQALLNQRFATEAKLVTLQTDYAVQTAKNTEEIKKTNKELRTRAAYDAAAPNSLERVRALRAKIRLEVDKTNLNDGARIAQLNDRINKLTAIEKKFTDTQRQQSLNVGNYQGSAKIIVDALERIRIKQVEVNKTFGEGSPEAQQVRKEYEALDKVVSNPQFLNISAKMGDTNAELKFFAKQLNVLEDAGLKNSAIYKEVQQRLAQLTDQLGDTRAEIKALSSDTRGLDLFAGSVAFAADTFQTAAGAAVLFGASEEDAAQATSTLVAVQSVANGIKGIANELTTKGTAANKAYTFVLRELKTVTDSTASSSARLMSVLKLAGIGLAIAGLIKLVSYFSSTGDAAKRASVDIDRFNKSLENAVFFTNRYLSSVKTQTDVLIEKARQRGASEKEISDITVNGYKEEAKQFKALYDQKKGQLSGLAQQVDDATGGQLKLIDDYNRQFNEGAVGAADLISRLASAKISGTYDNLSKKQQEAFDKLEGSAKEVNGLLETYYQADASANLETEKFKTKTIEDANKKRLELIKKNAEEIKRINEANAQANFELQKLELERQYNYYKLIADNESASYEDRVTALKIYADTKTKIIDLTAKYEASREGLTAKEIEVINKKADAERLEERRAFYDESIRLYNEYKQKLADEDAAAKAEMDAISDQVSDQINASIDDQLKKWSEAYKKDEDNFKALQEKKKELTEKLSSELQNTLFAFIDAGIDRQKNALQAQLDQLEINKAREIELAGGNADAIAVIEARAQIQREAIERKQRELNVKKAQFDKAQAVARIIQETAIAIVANLKTPALIPLVIAIGAAQLAAVLATPIPRYKDGGKHPGGPMIVGDGGKAEGVVFPDGTVMKTPAKSTLMDAPAGTVIHKDFNTMMFNSTMTKPVEYKPTATTDSNLKVITGLKAVEKAIEKIPQPTFILQNVMKQRVRYGHSINEHIKRNLGK